MTFGHGLVLDARTLTEDRICAMTRCPWRVVRRISIHSNRPTNGPGETKAASNRANERACHQHGGTDATDEREQLLERCAGDVADHAAPSAGEW